MQHDTYEACYRPKGRTSKLAIIVRLRMLQDTLLNLRLQQAKITSTVLELQAVESKTRLDSAVTAWRNSLAQEPMFSVHPHLLHYSGSVWNPLDTPRFPGLLYQKSKAT